MTNSNKKQVILNAIADYKYGREWQVDGRRSATKAALAIGLTKSDISTMRVKYVRRMHRRIETKTNITHQDRLRFLAMVKECTYDPAAQSSRYNSTGIDWKAFHRAASNGKGWVLIAPDEPGNNWYVEDALLVKYLSKRFEK